MFEKILSSIDATLKKRDIPELTLKPLPKDLKSFVRQTMVLPAKSLLADHEISRM